MKFERSRRASSLMFNAARSFVVDYQSGGPVSEDLMASHARTFHFAARFFPSEYRQSAKDLYAFFRTLDDFVDESDTDARSRSSIEVELAAWKRWFAAGLRGQSPDQAVGEPLAQVVIQYRIPPVIFQEFLAGLRSDLNGTTYTDRAALEAYCYQVASTVGIAMSCVFGVTDRAAHRAAVQLGIAMQLTNILRDIGGDLARDRVYLPEDLLNAHSLDAATLFQLWNNGDGPDDRLRRVMCEMIRWADAYYQAGNHGIRYLPADARLSILIASRLYQEILRQIERNGYDSLRRRASTSTFQKSVVACRSVLELTGHPAGTSSDEWAAHSSVNVEEHTAL